MKFLVALLVSMAFQQAYAFDQGFTVTSKIVNREDKDDLTVVTIDGALNRGVADAAIDALQKAGDHNLVLELNSPGGYLDEAQKIYDYIKGEESKGLELMTFVPSGSVCASACTIIFISGQERIAGEAAAFMVHGVQRETMPGFLNPVMTSFVQKLYIDNGVTATWINQLREKKVLSGINDFWFSGRDAALKEVNFATGMTSGLIEYTPPPIDLSIHAR